MDRIHFIAQQVERLDDQAFAAFLAWFDRHADLRWAGQAWPAEDAECRRERDDRRLHGAQLPATTASRGASPRRVCEPQAAAWLAQMMHRE